VGAQDGVHAGEIAPLLKKPVVLIRYTQLPRRGVDELAMMMTFGFSAALDHTTASSMAA
jgi:hypothetical protein